MEKKGVAGKKQRKARASHPRGEGKGKRHRGKKNRNNLMIFWCPRENNILFSRFTNRYSQLLILLNYFSNSMN